MLASKVDGSKAIREAGMDQSAHDLSQALILMKQALALIDRAARAHDVGAHLDLAIHRLSELIGPDVIELPLSTHRGR